MYTGFQHLHSGIAYLLLPVLILTVLYALVLSAQKRSFTESVRKVALVGLILTHLQLLAGVILYFVSPLGAASVSGEAMQDATMRLYILEHPITMLIGVGLITAGYARAKRPGDDAKRFRHLILFYSLGLVLFLLRIPWQAWP